MESGRGPEAGRKDSDLATSGNRLAPRAKADLGYYSMSTTSSADGRVMIGQDIEIFAGKPRPELARF